MIKFYSWVFVVIIMIHSLLVAGMVASAVALVIYEPWYIWLPLNVWIINLAILPVRCPLTTLENYVRKKLGLPSINSFIKVHFLGKER